MFSPVNYLLRSWANVTDPRCAFWACAVRRHWVTSFCHVTVPRADVWRRSRQRATLSRRINADCKCAAAARRPRFYRQEKSIGTANVQYVFGLIWFANVCSNTAWPCRKLHNISKNKNNSILYAFQFNRKFSAGLRRLFRSGHHGDVADVVNDARFTVGQWSREVSVLT